MRSRFAAMLFFLGAALLPLSAAAQAAPVASTDPFLVNVSPQYPGSNASVTLSFSSAMLDLANATVRVLANGTAVYQGAVQPVTITLGAGGSTTSLSFMITENGATYTKTLTLRPEDVALVPEPLSTAPPLYAGKPLVPLQGAVRVVAVADLYDASGAPLDPSTLSYAWTLDGAQIADASGIGKDSIIIPSPLEYRTRTVSVLVQSPDGATVGGDTLTLSGAQPTLRIYAVDPLLGIRFDRALSGTQALSGSESTFYAAPFSLPLDSSPAIEWFLNGSAAQTGPTITVRPAGSGQGSASLSSTVSLNGSVAAQSGFTLSFGSSQSPSFFGL